VTRSELERHRRDFAATGIVLVMLLATASGAIDVVAFLQYKVFVANQTGNLVVIAVGASDGNSSSTVLPSAVSLVSFTAALVAVAWISRVQINRGRESTRVRRDALIIEAVLLTVAATLILFNVDFEVRYGVISVLAISQGIQAVVLTRVLGVAVQTVAINGSLFNTVQMAVEHKRRAAAVAVSTPIGYAIGAGLGAFMQVFASAYALFFAAALGVIALFVAAKHRKLASLVGADEGGPAPDG